MCKKLFKIVIVMVLIFSSIDLTCYADTLVIVKPKTVISTSNTNLNEGDYVHFVIDKDVFFNNILVIKKGEEVTGLMLEIIPNDWSSTPAKVTIGQFETKDIDGERLKLYGSIYKTGTMHDIASALFSECAIRGGEVQIKPYKDKFTLFLKDKL